MSKYLSLLLLCAPAYAQSGADALLETLGQSVANVPQTGSAVSQTSVKLDNPVAVKLFSDWNSQKSVPYEINAWVQKFLGNDFEGYAHLKTAMEAELAKIESTSFKNSLNAAYVYSLYRMNLPQTFLNEWISKMEQESFSTSDSAVALDTAIAAIEPMENWLMSRKIQFSSTQEATIQKIGFTRHVNWLALNAFTFQRKGLAGEALLPKLTVNNPIRPKLAMTVTLAYSKKGDLAQAAKTLKTYYEPWMNQAKDANASSKYALEIARLLYQAGSIDGAIQYYQKIPKGSPDYLTAREELSWCWLRQGNLSELRGNLASFQSSVVADQFRPEASLVRAISNLKLCNYAEVEKDFQTFVAHNRDWAKKIETNIQATESALPRHPDDFSSYAAETVKNQEREIAELDALAVRSGSAALPAVGVQKHWADAAHTLKIALESAKKRQADEYRRQWKMDQYTLQEAIRKMQFVKVELLSQLSQEKQLTRNDSVAPAVVESAKQKIKTSGDRTFPFDGVVWPDEMFKLKAVVNTQCTEKL